MCIRMIKEYKLEIRLRFQSAEQMLLHKIIREIEKVYTHSFLFSMVFTAYNLASKGSHTKRAEVPLFKHHYHPFGFVIIFNFPNEPRMRWGLFIFFFFASWKLYFGNGKWMIQFVFFHYTYNMMSANRIHSVTERLQSRIGWS